jgi:hypothetical protein
VSPPRRRVKLLVFSLLPLVLLALTAETALRIKYFFSHNRDWSYLIAPIGGRAGETAKATIWTYVKAAPSATSPATPSAGGAASPPPSAPASASTEKGAPPPASAPAAAVHATTPVATPSPPTTPASAGSPSAPATVPAAHVAQQEASRAQGSQQMVFRWQKPCTDQVVHSIERDQDMPRTWDDNCFRGDHVGKDKPVSEYRIFVVGGSTVEDAQSDAEMWTAQLRRKLPASHAGKQITVVNAGKAGYESHRVYLFRTRDVS